MFEDAVKDRSEQLQDDMGPTDIATMLHTHTHTDRRPVT